MVIVGFFMHPQSFGYKKRPPLSKRNQFKPCVVLVIVEYQLTQRTYRCIRSRSFTPPWKTCAIAAGFSITTFLLQRGNKVNTFSVPTEVTTKAYAVQLSVQRQIEHKRQGSVSLNIQENNLVLFK